MKYVDGSIEVVTYYSGGVVLAVLVDLRAKKVIVVDDMTGKGGGEMITDC